MPRIGKHCRCFLLFYEGCNYGLFVKMCLERPAGRDKHENKNKFPLNIARAKRRQFKIVAYLEKNEASLSRWGRLPSICCRHSISSGLKAPHSPFRIIWMACSCGYAFL